MSFLGRMSKRELIAFTDELNHRLQRSIEDMDRQRAFYEKARKRLETENNDVKSAVAGAYAAKQEIEQSWTKSQALLDQKVARIDNSIQALSDTISNEVSDRVEAELSPRIADTVTGLEKNAADAARHLNAIEPVAEKGRELSATMSALAAKARDDRESVEKQSERISSYHYELFGDEEGNTSTGPSQRKLIEAQMNAAEELTKKNSDLLTQSEGLLGKMTDTGLHAAFADAAKRYMFGSWAILIAQSAVLLAMSFLAWSAVKQTDLVEILTRILPTIPLAFLVYLLFKAQSVEKKLAEEYRYKSTLTKTIAGYRAIFKLDHDDDEYKRLFSEITDGIVRNPSDEINPLLSGKLPIDTVTDVAARIADRNSAALSEVADRSVRAVEASSEAVVSAAKTTQKVAATIDENLD